MNKDFTVLIDYLNRELQQVVQKAYGFNEYSGMLELEIKRLILDVEDAFYKLQDGKQKAEWSDEATKSFMHIRHKLLDVANAVGRLPKTLHYKGVSCADVNLSELVADIVNKASGQGDA